MILPKNFILLLILAALIFSFFKVNLKPKAQDLTSKLPWWSVQSIDTMKYSRDEATAKMDDPSFDEEINSQMKNIKATGANYVAVDTPYDSKFLPYLKRWVNAARTNDLHIWFKGNWSNWEGWFGFQKQMTFDQHIEKSVQFIQDNPDLFQDGDSFTACPECENGAEGDPRQTSDVLGYRNFLINEVTKTKEAFDSIHKNVSTNWLSMNKDVANLIMDTDTVKKIGGVIVIDHYVYNPHQLAQDVNSLSELRQAKVILGEFGAPIDDINGSFTDDEQAKWLQAALSDLAQSPNLIGINYWVDKGGNTQLWREDNSPRPAVNIITGYYSPPLVYGKITDNKGNPLDQVKVQSNLKLTQSSSGNYRLNVISDSTIQFSKPGYLKLSKQVTLDGNQDINLDVTLVPENHSIFEKIINLLKTILPKV